MPLSCRHLTSHTSLYLEIIKRAAHNRPISPSQKLVRNATFFRRSKLGPHPASLTPYSTETSITRRNGVPRPQQLTFLRSEHHQPASPLPAACLRPRSRGPLCAGPPQGTQRAQIQRWEVGMYLFNHYVSQPQLLTRNLSRSSLPLSAPSPLSRLLSS